MTFDGISLTKVLLITQSGTLSAEVGLPPRLNASSHSPHKVRGQEVGSGRAFRKKVAMDEAARMGLRLLYFSPSPPPVSMLTYQRRNSFP